MLNNLQKLAQSGAVVCFINSNRAWGGGENWHLGAARYFAEQGCRVLICGRSDGELYRRACEFTAAHPELAAHFTAAPWHFSNLDFLNICKVRRFSRFLRENGVTHLITGQTRDAKGAVLAARCLPVKVYYRRGLAFPVKDNWLNRKVYGALDGLIANSRSTADLLLQNKGMLDPAKVRVIYNAVDIERFDAALRASSGGSPLAPLNGRFIIGNAGRLTAQKGQKYLLHMSAELKRRGFAHAVLIAGDGELREELAQLAVDLRLRLGEEPESGADVILPGFMRDMSAFWRGIDFFMLSSLWEGFGYVLAEAMLASKAVCAFNVNSMPEVVEDGANGFLLPPPGAGETDAQVGARLADLVEAVSREPEKLASMGQAGRKICEKRFEKSLVMDELAAFMLQA